VVADPGRFLRLQGMIKAARDSADPDAADALTDVYVRCRREVVEAVDDVLAREFERFFPPTIPPGSATAGDVRVELATMVGWLEGLAQEASFQLRSPAGGPACGCDPGG
jgi:hypothetical protein